MLDDIVSFRIFCGLEELNDCMWVISFLFRYNSPFSIAPKICEIRIIIPILTFPNMFVATVPIINNGPEVLANEVIVWASDFEMFPDLYKSDVSFAPTG